VVDRRDVIVASATALTTSLIAQSTPAFAQSVNVPGTKRGFVERPGCRIYYEVTGSGPAVIFAHGVGSNHMTWWQQVAHLSDRYTCIAFSHRGYPPSSEIGIPDPSQYAGDLAALIEHLQLPDVRLVAQSMGGWTCLEYILQDPRKVRALVLTSTCGSIDRTSIPLVNPQRLTEWDRMADAARADMARRGISPPAGERMAKEQPSLHYLYREIANASAAFDRAELRKRLFAIATRPADVLRSLSTPTLFVTGGEDRNYPPFLSDALAPMMPNAKVEHVSETGHSVYFQRPEIYNRLVGVFLSTVG
jgi:3-oxoadipate enol-lactonase